MSYLHCLQDILEEIKQTVLDCVCTAPTCHHYVNYIFQQLHCHCQRNANQIYFPWRKELALLRLLPRIYCVRMKLNRWNKGRNTQAQNFQNFCRQRQMVWRPFSSSSTSLKALPLFTLTFENTLLFEDDNPAGRMPPSPPMLLRHPIITQSEFNNVSRIWWMQRAEATVAPKEEAMKGFLRGVHEASLRHSMANFTYISNVWLSV